MSETAGYHLPHAGLLHSLEASLRTHLSHCSNFMEIIEESHGLIDSSESLLHQPLLSFRTR